MYKDVQTLRFRFLCNQEINWRLITEFLNDELNHDTPEQHRLLAIIQSVLQHSANAGIIDPDSLLLGIAALYKG